MEQKAKITKDGLNLNGKLYPLAPVTPRMMSEVLSTARARAISEFCSMANKIKLPHVFIDTQLTRFNSNRHVHEMLTSEDTAHLLHLRVKAAGATREEIDTIGQADIIEMEDLVFGGDPDLKLSLTITPELKAKSDLLASKHGLSAAGLCLKALGNEGAWDLVAQSQEGEDAPDEETGEVAAEQAETPTA